MWNCWTPFVEPESSKERSWICCEVLEPTEKREEVGVAGSPSHLQSGEFRLNLVTKCLLESQFPYLHSEVAHKEFPKHQI